MPVLDVNMDANIKLTAKLERLHRSAFPVAIRQTLNGAAFLAKKEMPKTAQVAFKKSNRPGLATFIRAFSSVEKAKGFDINKMSATVGINSQKGSDIASGLEKQEFGGVIKSRKLIPHDKGRTSGSYQKRLQKKNQFGKISLVSGSPSVRRSKKSNVVAQAYIAAQTGKHILQKKNRKGNTGTIFEVRSINPVGTGRNRNVKFKIRPVYIYRKNKISKVSPAPFVRPAARIAYKQMSNLYYKEAHKQFDRLLK